MAGMWQNSSTEARADRQCASVSPSSYMTWPSLPDAANAAGSPADCLVSDQVPAEAMLQHSRDSLSRDAQQPEIIQMSVQTELVPALALPARHASLSVSSSQNSSMADVGAILLEISHPAAPTTAIQTAMPDSSLADVHPDSASTSSIGSTGQTAAGSDACPPHHGPAVLEAGGMLFSPGDSPVRVREDLPLQPLADVYDETSTWHAQTAAAEEHDPELEVLLSLLVTQLESHQGEPSSMHL